MKVRNDNTKTVTELNALDLERTNPNTGLKNLFFGAEASARARIFLSTAHSRRMHKLLANAKTGHPLSTTDPAANLKDTGRIRNAACKRSIKPSSEAI
jgi:hypothetical protein